MKIRQAAENDIHILSATIQKAYQTVADRFGLSPDNCPKHPSNCNVEWIRADFKRDVSYYVLESEGGIVGCAALEKADPGRCYLERLAVLPEKRHQGFGKQLVDHIFLEARTKGCTTIGIGIIAKQRELKHWYNRIGFVDGETKTFEHLPFQVLFMECCLD